MVSSNNTSSESTTKAVHGNDLWRKYSAVFKRTKTSGTDTNESGDGVYFSKYRGKSFLSALPRYLGWILCSFITLSCGCGLMHHGVAIQMDYAFLWFQILYISVCASLFILQPVVVAFYTLYKVSSYRWFGYYGPFHFSEKMALDQAISVWNHYKKSVLSIYDPKKLQDPETQGKDKNLRHTLPPKEEYLLQCRSKKLMHDRISSLFKFSFRYICLLSILSYSAQYHNVREKYLLNESLRNSVANGSCYERNYDNPLGFQNIKDLNDWWDWSGLELLDLMYHRYPNYSTYWIFCDTESVVIGFPRVRFYYTDSGPCEYKSTEVNHSALDYDDKCYPKYIERSNSSTNYTISQYDDNIFWKIPGIFGTYGYTPHTYSFPQTKYEASFVVFLWEIKSWFQFSKAIRCIIVDFTLYHVPTKLYSSLSLMAEFPASAGANTTILVDSVAIERDSTFIHFASQLFYLTAAMYFFRRSCIQIFVTGGKLWLKFWYILDFISTVYCWCYVILSMYRVRVAENVNQDLETSYFNEYVNIRGLIALDEYQRVCIASLLAMHILKVIWVLNYLPTFYHLSNVVHCGMKEAFRTSFVVFVIMFICSYFGNKFFVNDSEYFRGSIQAFLTVMRTLVYPMTFTSYLEDLVGISYVCSRMYFLVIFILYAYFIFGIFKAIFIYTMKNYRKTPRFVEISAADIRKYLKELFMRKSTHALSSTADGSLAFHLNQIERKIDQTNHLIERIFDSEYTNVYNNPSTGNSEYEFADDHTSALADDDTVLGAFKDVQSCPSELSSTVRDALDNFEFRKKYRSHDVKELRVEGRIGKFLQDVASTNNFESTVCSYGKYGKTKGGSKHVTFHLNEHKQQLHEDLDCDFRYFDRSREENTEIQDLRKIFIDQSKNIP